MSRLKELRLHGFKTFADRTIFAFSDGVNAVIGPNGSGKSNMADAVRWVLGEQSNRFLRTRRAEDVIFAGSEGRRAQGMAEVVLTLDNSAQWLPIDFGEVTIGRRAYRSGEGEYLLNGARVRLRDLHELLEAGRLGSNSLVVVGQGTVDAALSLRPDERRQLFEEAAGVKGLQVRKNEASVRLARAAENLTRLSDLTAELRPQVRRLELQARHQREHDQLGRRTRALVEEWHRRRERGARSALGEAQRTEAAAAAAVEALRAELGQGREALALAEAAYWGAEEAARRAGETRERAREAVIRAEARLEAVRQREDELHAQLTAPPASLAGTSDREALARIEAEERSAAADAERARESLEAATRASTEASSRLDRARQVAADLEPRAADARRHATQLAERAGGLRAELEAVRERIELGSRLASALSADGWRSLLDGLDLPADAWATTEAVIGGALDQALLWREGDIGGHLAEGRGIARLLLAGTRAPSAPERRTALAALQATQTLAERLGGGELPDLFHRTVLAPSLDRLLAGWRNLPPGWAAVTVEGDLADARGLIVLRGRRDGTGSEAARLHARRAELTRVVERLEREHQAAGAAAARAVARLVAAARDEELAREAAAVATRRVGEAQAAVEGAAARLARLALERETLAIAAAPAAAAETATALEAVRVQRTELERELGTARGAEESATEARDAAEAQRTARRDELLEVERRSAGASARLAELESAAHAAAIEVSRLGEALGGVARERALALEGLPEVADATGQGSDGAADLAAEVSGLDDEPLEAELRSVRRTLAQIGSVNPFAVEEHRELAARLDTLTAQESDLRAAMAATGELIGRLDAEISERFNSAFAAIGERFDEYARLLFAGGSAGLSIDPGEDREAPGGIEIVVRPPGKRLQRLAMLSGGERALTGVALLFAMLSFNPVPFCILDEVDAALDEANIGRFAEALRKLAETIDFVVITHNRATIETADTIYGVTMTDAAASRVLSLRLSDVPAEVSA